MAKKFIDSEKFRNEVNILGWGDTCDGEYNDAWDDAMSAILEILDNQPAADVQEVRHGKWKDANETFECSICGYSFENEGYMHFFNFCPCCGARMDGEINA
ncbi:MAG: hypothetical protein Q4E74_09655 [Ruminococcus sp.]|nr:hypothetical protein [Ruminococcus sp.]